MCCDIVSLENMNSEIRVWTQAETRVVAGYNIVDCIHTMDIIEQEI